MAVSSAVTWALPSADPAKLRRIPRIYNALITSDEELLPSQAYPAVAPVLRPAPLPFAPYYGLAPVYAPASYSELPGFNDTLQDPQASQPAAPVLSLQAQQTIPQVCFEVVWSFLVVSLKLYTGIIYVKKMMSIHPCGIC